MRTALLHVCKCPQCQQIDADSHIYHHRAMNLLMRQLTAPQRRLYAAIESVQIGLGGVSSTSEISGLSASTIRRGRKDLATLLAGHEIEKPLGRPGRKLTEVKFPGIELVLEKLLSDGTAGDPMSGKTWIRLSSRNISKKLESLGYNINQHTICRILSKMGYSLKVNVKKRASTINSPKRYTQFQYILSP